MGGCYVHTRTFQVKRWDSERFGPHHEVGGEGPDDSENFSYRSWLELQAYTEARGLSPELWPAFMDCNYGLDVPLEALKIRQEPFRRAIEALPAGVIAGNAFLARIAGHLRDGQQLLFTN